MCSSTPSLLISTENTFIEKMCFIIRKEKMRMFFEMVLDFKVRCEKSTKYILSSCIHSQIAIWCAYIVHLYNNMQS